MTVPVIKYGSTILRKKSLEVSRHENLCCLNNILEDTLISVEGIGLAAPQTGILLRSFIIDSSVYYQNTLHYHCKLYINPEITWKSTSEITFAKACLSMPGICENVTRPEKIQVKYYNYRFNMVEEELNGLNARIFQHEFDHLHGILFIDYLSSVKRKRIVAKFNQIQDE